jgi:hypothetical protein
VQPTLKTPRLVEALQLHVHPCGRTGRAYVRRLHKRTLQGFQHGSMPKMQKSSHPSWNTDSFGRCCRLHTFSLSLHAFGGENGWSKCHSFLVNTPPSRISVLKGMFAFGKCRRSLQKRPAPHPHVYSAFVAVACAPEVGPRTRAYKSTLWHFF